MYRVVWLLVIFCNAGYASDSDEYYEDFWAEKRHNGDLSGYESFSSTSSTGIPDLNDSRTESDTFDSDDDEEFAEILRYEYMKTITDSHKAAETHHKNGDTDKTIEMLQALSDAQMDLHIINKSPCYENRPCLETRLVRIYSAKPSKIAKDCQEIRAFRESEATVPTCKGFLSSLFGLFTINCGSDNQFT
ncbi:MAG: hypothetical protein NTX76_03080 [Alphaproteobacteria bacterium]|nr:hypothetical protein [Alphaproteobacteria bacterium]